MTNISKFLKLVWAETAKIWAFRIPLYAFAGILAFVSLVGYDLFYGEHLRSHMELRHWLTLLPLLYWASWGRLLVMQIIYIFFPLYCVCVDSQYGMARVVYSQPFSRMTLAAAKIAAVMVHTLLIASFYCLVMVAWSGFAAGWRGVTWASAGTLLAFVFEFAMYSVAFSALIAFTSMLRRSIIGALSSVFLVFIGLFAMNSMPGVSLQPYVFVRYWMYALTPFGMHALPFELPNMAEPFLHYVIACLAPCSVMAAISLLWLHTRDIKE